MQIGSPIKKKIVFRVSKIERIIFLAIIVNLNKSHDNMTRMPPIYLPQLILVSECQNTVVEVIGSVRFRMAACWYYMTIGQSNSKCAVIVYGQLFLQCKPRLSSHVGQFGIEYYHVILWEVRMQAFLQSHVHAVYSFYAIPSHYILFSP